MINISMAAVDELRYKISIMLDEPDLIESYGTTEDELLQFEHKLNRDGGQMVLTEKELQIAYGELGNTAEMDYANWKTGKCSESRKSYNKLKAALDELEAYAEANGYDKGE